jgi:hypothetical protein
MLRSSIVPSGRISSALTGAAEAKRGKDAKEVKRTTARTMEEVYMIVITW